MNEKRAAIYTRVSTTGQKDFGYSLPTQLDGCRIYATKNGFQVVAELADDSSGAIPIVERAKGKELYKLVDSGAVDAVILYTNDRTARDELVLEYLLFKSYLFEHGIELHYSDTGLDPYTMEGNLVGYIKAHGASAERKKIAERSRRGKTAKAEAGKWIGSMVPFGYSREGVRRDSRLKIDPTPTATVQEIYRAYVGDGCSPMTLYQIADMLNIRGVPTAHAARVWHPSAVRYILTNPVYLGDLRFSGVTTQHPELAIIDPVLFDAAQERIKRNKAMSKRNRKHEYLLAGRIKCECDHAMYGFLRGVGSKGKRLEYYGCCGNLARGPHIKTCDARTVRADIMGGLVWDAVIGSIQDEQLAEGLRQRAARRSADLEPQRIRLAQINGEIDKELKRIRNLSAAIGNATDDDARESLEAEQKRASQHKNNLTTERDRVALELAETELTEARQENIKMGVARLRRKLEGGGKPTFKQKRELFDVLDVQVKVYCGDDPKKSKHNRRKVDVSYILSDDPLSIEYTSST